MALSFNSAAKSETSPPQGTWSGVLALGAIYLRMKFVFGANGAVNLSTPDQGGQSTEGSITSFGAGHIEIEFQIGENKAYFSGHLAGLDQIDGMWTQGGNSSWLVLNRGQTALLEPSAFTLERLTELRSASGSPAMAAIAARRNSSARVWADGERAIGTGIAVQENDLWHIGSLTKSMTSALVARLADSGQLSWDDTVGHVLSAVAPEMRDVYRAVTLRHLMCHHSGLSPDLPITDLLQYSETVADAREERKSYVRRCLAMEPVGPMTTSFQYSNSGYVVAGVMLEVMLGKSWEDLITTHLFRPLGLSSAGFGAPGRQGAVDQPVGHQIAGVGQNMKTFLNYLDANEGRVAGNELREAYGTEQVGSRL